MECEKMVYHYSDLQKCAKQIKTINLTVKHKNEHFSSAAHVKEVQDFCFNTTHDWNFLYEHSIVEDYFKAAYDFKNHTKKELDTMLKHCYQNLAYEINSILTDWERGELNVLYD